MKILILGAGQVGTSVASALASENNDITVVDTDHQRLRDLAEKLDIRTVIGHASLPDVLAQAGAEEAELLVAVTSSDEVNLIACQVAQPPLSKVTFLWPNAFSRYQMRAAWRPPSSQYATTCVSFPIPAASIVFANASGRGR